MPSITARIMGFVLRKTGVFRKNYTGGPDLPDKIAAARAAPAQLPTEKMKAKLDVSETAFQGRSVWRIAPRGRAPVATVLYYHGGGYIYPAVSVHWDFYAHLAEKHGLAIVAPLYPLAPEHDAAEATAFALDHYRAFLDAHSGPFVLGGDSAGGGLAAVVVQAARDEGLRLPQGLALVCPWLDASASDPAQEAIEARDSILTLSGIRQAAGLYARDLAVSDPKVSPIHGGWGGLPPILAFGGGDDILVTDARALKAAVPSTDYVEEAGLMHDWPLFFLPESRRAQARIAAFAESACRA